MPSDNNDATARYMESNGDEAPDDYFDEVLGEMLGPPRCPLCDGELYRDGGSSRGRMRCSRCKEIY